MQLSITPLAQQQLSANLTEGNMFVRLSVEPGGCAGMSYALALDETQSEADQVIFEEGSLRVVTDPNSAQYLDGLTIDFSDDLVESGFRLSNPNAQKSCGCGSSFGGCG